LQRHGGVFPGYGHRADWRLRAPAPRHRHCPLRHPRHWGRDPAGEPQPQAIWEPQSVCSGQAPWSWVARLSPSALAIPWQ
jgi:hypothetical protein